MRSWGRILMTDTFALEERRTIMFVRLSDHAGMEVVCCEHHVSGTVVCACGTTSWGGLRWLLGSSPTVLEGMLEWENRHLKGIVVEFALGKHALRRGVPQYRGGTS